MDTTYSLKLPPESYRRTIEELSVVIPDPALKLKFLKQAINEYQKISAPGEPGPEIADSEFRTKLLENAENIWPGSIKAAKKIHRNDVTDKKITIRDVIAIPNVKFFQPNRFHYIIGSAVLMFLIVAVVTATSFLTGNSGSGAPNELNARQVKSGNTKTIIRKPILYSRTSNGKNNSTSPVVKAAIYQNEPGEGLISLQNPLLAALTTFQQTEIIPADRIDQKPLKSLLQSEGKNQVHPKTPKTENSQVESEQVKMPEFLKNPVLVALTTVDKAEITASNPVVRIPAVSSQPTEGQSQVPPPAIITDKFVIRYDQKLPDFLKNPILAALTTSHKTGTTASEPIAYVPVKSSRPTGSENQASPPILQTDISQVESDQIPDFLKNPVLAALRATQSTKMAISEPVTAQTPVDSLRPPQSENLSSSPAVKIVNYQIESEQASEFSENRGSAACTTVNNTEIAASDPAAQMSVVSIRPSQDEKQSFSTAIKILNYQIESEHVPEFLDKPIWLIEKTADREIYSNRLQIITTHTVTNEPRRYCRLPKNSDELPANSKISNKISGIVFHASESDLYPFMPEMNRSILKYSKRLIKFLMRKKSYNFFIDRFGRVYRLVQEDHAAYHAGNSIWADDEEVYLNLNHAFIGICFEGKDFEEINVGKQKKGKTSKAKPRLLRPTGISSFNEAQLRSGKELTDWLRVKYKIPQHNCVPHALISVNPKRMLIGWHLDLSHGFPFERFGLSDKYQEPLPSMVEFGFFYDRYFEKIFNGNLWYGIHWSEEILLRRARQAGMSFAEYRKSLHQRFTRYADLNKKIAK